ncbi:MAG: HIT family protein [Parcubacteria group bacterium]|jgi:histidine triad (HIT) family protein
MHNHAEPGYQCPICLGVRKIENKDTLIKKSDIVFQNKLVTAFVASFFVGRNAGHLIIVPNRHFENIYDLPEEYGKEIFRMSKKLALAAKKAYLCDGITIMQNNEPGGDQHAFHYHLHIFPRYEKDDFSSNMNNKKLTDFRVRRSYAEKIKRKLKINLQAEVAESADSLRTNFS